MCMTYAEKMQGNSRTLERYLRQTYSNDSWEQSNVAGDHANHQPNLDTTQSDQQVSITKIWSIDDSLVRKKGTFIWNSKMVFSLFGVDALICLYITTLLFSCKRIYVLVCYLLNKNLYNINVLDGDRRRKMWCQKLESICIWECKRNSNIYRCTLMICYVYSQFGQFWVATIRPPTTLWLGPL